MGSQKIAIVGTGANDASIGARGFDQLAHQGVIGLDQDS
jgi:hypothetical protein